ncbi:hypothetical protein [Ruminococcus sp. JE7B6]|uniref:hypothetical protein n=1 Tax=Ruminococcus sp. JE7B6 TaxID=3233380 RepID=UPI00389AC110
MDKSVKTFAYRFISILLSVLIVISASLVGLISTNAISSNEIKAGDGARLFTVITSNIDKAFCYWWKDETENGFIADANPKTNNTEIFWNFSIPDSATQVTITTEDHWNENPESDNADIKLTDALTIGSKMSSHLVINLAKSEKTLSDFVNTSLSIKKQDEPIIVKKGNSVDIAKFEDFKIEGSLADYVDNVAGYEGDTLVANVSANNTMSYATESLGKHTIEFAVTDAIGNLVKADNDYTVYNKTNREELSFEGNTSVSMVFGVAQKPLAIKGLSENDSVSYTSSNPNIAVVDSDGMIVPVGVGNTTITATVAETDSYFEASADYDVEVSAGNGNDYVAFAKNVDFDTPENIVYGETFENPVSFNSAANPDAVVTYSSSDESIATVDSNGTVSAVSVSNTAAIITAKVTGLSNLTDAELQYQLFVNKAELTVPDEDIKSETVDFKPELMVDCSDNFKLPITDYAAKYEITSQKALDKKTIKDAATIDSDGVLKVSRSGIFEIKATISSDNYNDKELEFTVTVRKADRTDFSYEENTRNLFVGCSYDIPVPANLLGTEFSIAETDKDYAKLEGNKIVALKKKTDGVVVTASIAEDDCYKAAQTSITFILDYFTPAENPPYTISGETSSTSIESAYVGDVTIKPTGEYKIALYNEDASNNTELQFSDTITLSNNISNPRIVLKSNSSVEGLTGAVSDVIDTGLFLDKTKPTGTITANELEKSFNALLQLITFGLYTPSQTFTIEAEDNESNAFESGRDGDFGDVRIEYYIDKETVEGESKTAADLDELASEKWIEYEDTFTVKDINARTVVYAKLTDPFGNYQYICTEDIVFDTERPRVTVSFDNNSFSEEYYFNAPRTMTVVVEDDNFVPSDNMFAISAKDFQGKGIETPSVNWNGNTATVNFTVDGFYEFDVTDNLVDLAGNKCLITYDDNTRHANKFVIDTTAPKVLVTYNNNNAQDKYFDNFREATITVDEPNFTAKENMIEITAVDAEVPSVKWEKNEAKVEFSSEGEFTFAITDGFVDKAGNKAEVTYKDGTVAAEDFVIDKTKPVVELSFDNNDSDNSYFNSERIATITVTDKHFVPSDGMIKVIAQSATPDEVEAPVVKWNENGNIATVEFKDNAHYKLEITNALVDLAGNGFDEVSVDKGTVYAYEFTVDTVDPIAVIKYDNNDVKNDKYFNTNRTATIEVDDVNFEGTPDMLKITAENAKGEMHTPELSWDGNVGTIEFTEDGVYTIEVNENKFKDSANNICHLGYPDGTEAPFEFVIDKTAPVVSVEITNTDNVNGDFYNQSRTAKILVEDDNFVALEKMISVSANDVNGDVTSAPRPDCGGKSFEIVFDGDAKYTFSLTEEFVDKAGNNFTMAEGSEELYEFTVDQSAPEFLEVEYIHSKDGLSGTFQKLIELFTGNTVFFPDEVKAKITAKDKDSGINRIEYSAPAVGNQIGIKGVEKNTTDNSVVTEGFSVEFVIPAEYIGKVDATAYNNAELATTTDEGEIAVSSEKPSVKLELINEKEDYRFYNGKRYYNTDAKLRVTVRDVFFDAQGQVKDQLAIRNNLTITEKTDNGEPVLLTIPKTSDWNRVDGTNEYYADFVISSEGEKRIEASYINNVGKKAEDVFLDSFVIDHTVPTAMISYNNNNVVNGKYFSSPRTATISVSDNYFEFTDLSFDQSKDNVEKMFEISAEDINGKIIDNALPEVTISEDKQSATLYFEKDANYKISAVADKFVDFSNQQVQLSEADGTEAALEFCVDKTDSEFLEVEYVHSDEGLTGTFKKLVELFTGNTVYFPDTVTAKITAKDKVSGINRIDYSAPESEKATEKDLIGSIMLKTAENKDISESFSVSFNIPAEFKGKIAATAYNNAELTTNSDEGNIIVSKKKPVISLQIVDTKKPVTHNSIDYYNEDVTIRVKVEDVFFDAIGERANSSSTNLIITEATNDSYKNLDVNSLVWTRIGESNEYYTDIKLEVEGTKRFYVSYKNNVGKSDKKQLENFVIDKTAPEVSIKFDNNNVRNEKYFNAKRTTTVKVTDKYFVGLNNMLSVTEKNKNGAVPTVSYKYSWDAAKQNATITFEKDAFYTFNISNEFVDLAGNRPNVHYADGTKAPNDFVVDAAAPDELEILVQGLETHERIDDIKVNSQHSDIPKYYNKSAEVVISANDALLNPEDLKLEYSVVLSDATIDKKAYTGSFSFSPDRTFTVTAYVEDKSGNKTQIHSNKIILDKTAPDIDGISPEIKLNVNSNQPKIDKNNEKLYNGNVIVDFVITDPIFNNSCSGLNPSELKYEVLNNGQRSQSGVLSGAAIQFDGRLQKLSGSVTVEADKNNSNFVELLVYAKDNSENPAQDSAKMRIDITNPTIDVSYSNNSPDSSYTEYFNNSRTATIQITERNFNENKVVVKATKDGAVFTPGLSWSHSGTANTDSYIHTASIEYADDADYTFDITYTDEADNPASAVNYGNSVAPTKFTVDRTNPEIQISYNYNEATNGNYYNQHRVATITVTEHNFDAQRVTFSCTANDNGATVTAPSLSGWSDSGDIHTATVSFDNDALFVMNISLNDMAGNAANTVEEQRFYVDTKKPDIKLDGLEKNSANKGEKISFTLSTSDHNLNASTYDMKFTRIDINAGDGKNVFNSDHEVRTSTEITYSESNLVNDGIYRITCTATDMAGNKTSTSEIVNNKGDKMGEDEILFSVNRSGSTFSIKDDVREIIDKGYVQEISDDIVITEINPDKVDKYAVSLKVGNDQPRALNEGDNFTRLLDDSKPDKWKLYTYTIKKDNFIDEAAYSLAITTTDKADNTSYSETKNPDYSKEPDAKINFVVDRTIPQVVVNNLEEGGHYNVETQTVDIVANDDNLLQNVVIVLNGETVKEYSEEELAENGGRMTLDIPSSESLQNLKIEAVDAAANSTEDTEETEVHFNSFLVTTNLFIQFINNPVLVISSIAGVLLIAGGIVFLVLRKKKKSAK